MNYSFLEKNPIELLKSLIASEVTVSTDSDRKWTGYLSKITNDCCILAINQEAGSKKLFIPLNCITSIINPPIKEEVKPKEKENSPVTAKTKCNSEQKLWLNLQLEVTAEVKNINLKVK